MKEVSCKHSGIEARPGLQPSDAAQAVFGLMELPHMAMAGGQGPVLSDEALLRLFCEGSGIPAGERTSFCENMLMRFGSLAAMFSSEQRTLSGIISLDRPLICTIALLHEAAIRVSRARMGEGDILANPRTMLDYLKSRLTREPIEQFRILFLDEQNHLLADEAQTRGTVNHTPVYPREVARRAMEIGARSIVLVHNHPSGDPTPSDADIAMTRDTQMAAALIDVRIADHIIIGNGSYSSFRELGLMKDR
ncbi:RadC family protein [Asaia bogorensis]|uniref:RadC family protein n=1 Tax=Asaia bogorensis TaxID=91915 RepID=UPI0028550C79|nr:DNA repair protein RadC [Asaia bogorensis]MDR6182191.1 DNA repair protein RadC [Asaia bogorensis NBRC 16594]